MKKCLLYVFVLCVSQSYAQKKINENLKQELDSIMKSDQILREYINFDTSESRKKEIEKELGRENDPDFRKGIWLEMQKRDSLNLIKIEEIIKQYGYPGKSLVGEPTNIAAWYVIQHGSKIGEYLPMIEQEAKKKEIPFTYFAKMQDRYLTQQGKEQIYGTQGQMKQITNKETGKKEFFSYVSPIQNPSKVNDRRKKAGFTTTVEENAKEMGMEYKVYTLDEIAKMN
ncbi:DUF6624 domain-containing protein [Flavobacterium tistrianum]|uniref:DUF6624 domain-containing protein n=1 Tax=Flavobacterium tistrianum TaxID=1685414 RepID=UPI000DAE0E89|nr:DUF6624 domain-containing protein [Flavobacterium tistrianum]KAF2342765.1 hypothetical protein DMB71_01915 [Flavobacterium tistrianum]